MRIKADRSRADEWRTRYEGINIIKTQQETKGVG